MNRQRDGEDHRVNGEEWEVACWRYLVGRGIRVVLNQGGIATEDLTFVDLPLSGECKARSRDELGRWIDQADAQRSNPGGFGIVMHPRKGAGVADGFVTMRLSEFFDLMEWMRT